MDVFWLFEKSPSRRNIFVARNVPTRLRWFFPFASKPPVHPHHVWWDPGGYDGYKYSTRCRKTCFFSHSFCASPVSKKMVIRLVMDFFLAFRKTTLGQRYVWIQKMPVGIQCFVCLRLEKLWQKWHMGGVRSWWLRWWYKFFTRTTRLVLPHTSLSKSSK